MKINLTFTQLKKRIQESNFKSLKQWFVFIKSKLLKYIQFQINQG